MNVMLTGASGFVGQTAGMVIEESGLKLVPVFRGHGSINEFAGARSERINCLDGLTDWTRQLEDIDVVVHLAAMVHVMADSDTRNLDQFRQVNVEGTRNLAVQAAESGVKRFVFMSSIKVLGERTDQAPFCVQDPANPEDAYAISKAEAEDSLREIENSTGMEVVIIRPPLVYGPDVKGNLRSLFNMIRKGFPMPLGAVENSRDLVSIYNLCDLIRTCIQHPSAAGRTFLVSDGETLSTPQLIQHIANGLGIPVRLFPVPTWLLKGMAWAVFRQNRLEKLLGNLEIDISETRSVLNWAPPLSVEQSFSLVFGMDESE